MDIQKEVKQEVKLTVDTKPEALPKKKRRARKTALKVDEINEPTKETSEQAKPVIVEDIVETNETQCECKTFCKCETQHESWFAKIYKAIVDFLKKIF